MVDEAANCVILNHRHSPDTLLFRRRFTRAEAEAVVEDLRLRCGPWATVLEVVELLPDERDPKFGPADSENLPLDIR